MAMNSSDVLGFLPLIPVLQAYQQPVPANVGEMEQEPMAPLPAAQARVPLELVPELLEAVLPTPNYVGEALVPVEPTPAKSCCT